ncbi:MAG: glycosyltransferase [Treponema sp.]|nr:glycosyltransferase [Treponema sp.]
MENKKLSVIVPVYNVEKYLAKCVDSILSQTFADFELILVDDGSTDSSPVLCDEYAKKDRRVRVIHQKNAGPGAARNAALEIACGEWIGFVDADDYVEPYMFSDLIHHSCDENIVSSNLLIEDSDTKAHILRNELFKNEKDNILGILDGRVQGFLHGKIIRRSFIYENDITFSPDLHMLEDNFFIIRCLISTTQCLYIPTAYYHYCQHENSYTHSIYSNKITDFEYAVDIIASFLFALKCSYGIELSIGIRKFKSRVKKLIISKCDISCVRQACDVWNGQKLYSVCTSSIDKSFFFLCESKLKRLAYALLFLKKQIHIQRVS